MKKVKQSSQMISVQISSSNMNKPSFPDDLFTERYKELIHIGTGAPEDLISGSISRTALKHISKVMFEFKEPCGIKRNRYDSWIDWSDALHEAVNLFHEIIGYTVFDIDYIPKPYEGCTQDELFAMYFTPFVLDVIELQYDTLSDSEKKPFQASINSSFERDGVRFTLSDGGLIEPVESHDVLSPMIQKAVNNISEPGIKDLLNEAIAKHNQPSMESHRDAVEKIWDALERLKTYYTTLDKKGSTVKIINDMAGGKQEFVDIFDAEFHSLTNIGNDFRIRHHETNKIDITDIRHYDYFFNRCLALIATAILYLE